MESDQWLDVQVVAAANGDQVRARHYVRSSETPPAEIADQVRQLAGWRNQGERDGHG